MEVSSDNDSWVCPAIRARTMPTRRWTRTRIGITITETMVRRQSMRIIATNDAITVTALPRIEVSVEVSTPDTPPTSFCRRDWMTPVLVRVKKASSMACRCSNSRTRRSPVTELPTVEVSQVWTTFSAADSRYSPTMPTTSRISSDIDASPSTGNSA